MMQIPLFNLLTVRQFRRQGDISVQTLVRIGDNYFMKAVDRRIKKDLYPNKECGLCGKELRVTTMPVSHRLYYGKDFLCNYSRKCFCNSAMN